MKPMENKLSDPEVLAIIKLADLLAEYFEIVTGEKIIKESDEKNKISIN